MGRRTGRGRKGWEDEERERWREGGTGWPINIEPVRAVLWQRYLKNHGINVFQGAALQCEIPSRWPASGKVEEKGCCCQNGTLSIHYPGETINKRFILVFNPSSSCTVTNAHNTICDVAIEVVLRLRLWTP